MFFVGVYGFEPQTKFPVGRRPCESAKSLSISQL